MQPDALSAWLLDGPPRASHQLPLRTPWQPEADVLMAQEECLSDSLYLCRRHLGSAVSGLDSLHLQWISEQNELKSLK